MTMRDYVMRSVRVSASRKSGGRDWKPGQDQRLLGTEHQLSRAMVVVIKIALTSVRGRIVENRLATVRAVLVNHILAPLARRSRIVGDHPLQNLLPRAVNLNRDRLNRMTLSIEV
jgi:hypothetical protein